MLLGKFRLDFYLVSHVISIDFKLWLKLKDTLLENQFAKVGIMFFDRFALINHTSSYGIYFSKPIISVSIRHNTIWIICCLELVSEFCAEI